jgi:hypothetical protein
VTKRFNPGDCGDLSGRDLFDRALAEVDELGPEPKRGDVDHWLWVEERRGAVELLAGLAGWDATALRRAALHRAQDEGHLHAAELLRDAAEVAALDDPSSYRADPDRTYRPPSPRPGLGMLRLLSHPKSGGTRDRARSSKIRNW